VTGSSLAGNARGRPMRVLLEASVSEGTRGGVATYIRRVAEGVEKLGATVDVL
jgi:hypothetical protein